MIDFKNSSFVKLKEISKEDGEKAVSMMLLDNENVFAAFKAIRDMVIFTDKRIISINVQGVTGAKKTIHPFRTAKYRFSPLKLQVLWIWMQSLSFGFQVAAKSSLNLKVHSILQDLIKY